MTHRFKVGEVEADFVYMRIAGADGEVTVEPKVMAVLQILVDRAGEVVTREELIEGVWQSHYGGEERLSRAISLLRKAFGDVKGSHQHIETVPRSGYRLIAPVTPIDADRAEDQDSRWKVGGSRVSVTAAVIALGAVVALFVWLILQGDSAGPASDSPAVSMSSSASQANSIAILPFKDLSPEGDQQYFADGLAEEVLNALARVNGLNIAGRTSSFAFRDQGNPQDIGTALRVNFILVGSVRKQDEHARVSVQLVRTRDGYHVWSESYDGDLSDIFEFQESIARSIARDLAPEDVKTDQGRLARRLTEDQQAYELYLQGRELSRRFGRQEKLAAIDLLEEAVARDPAFADAWAWLARSYLFVPITDPHNDSGHYIAAARTAVRHALIGEPNLAMAHYVMALLNDYDLKFDASMDSMERAHAAAPNQPFFIVRLGKYYALIGHVEKSVRSLEQGLRMDPTDAAGLMSLGLMKIHLGEVEEGLTLLQRSEALGFGAATLTRCIAMAALQLADQAMTCWRNVPIAMKNRYPKQIREPELWHAFGRAFIRGDESAEESVRPILLAAVRDAGTPANAYLLGALELIGEYELFLQTYVERPSVINSGVIAGLWRGVDGVSPVIIDPYFPVFAERVGLLRAWERHGWPDRCAPVPSPDSEAPKTFRCE